MANNPYYWTAAERDWMEKYVPGHHRKEIAEEHNRLFPRPVTTEQVIAYIKKHHLKTGFTGRFEAGREPHNKGVKVTDEAVKAKTLRTAFKPGNRPHNCVPIGTEAIRSNRYVKVKVGEPNKWEWKSRLVWEAAHGPCPEGYVLFHMNGDPTDDRLENIALVRKGDISIANRKGLLTCDADLNEVALNIARVTSAVTEAKKRQKK